MRKALLVLCLLLGTALPTSAQTRPDPATLASARSLIEETGVAKTIDALLGPMTQQLTQFLQATNPGQSSVVAQLVEDLVVPELRRRLPEFLELMTVLYAQHFSASEMDELRQFYRTPTGKKFIEKQTTLALEGQRIGNLWGQLAALQALEGLRPALEQRGLKGPRI